VSGRRFESCRAHQRSLAKRVKAAAPKPTWAKAGAARELRLGKPPCDHHEKDSRKADAGLAPNQNIENNPMQSSMVSLAWML
jgi:hypothetical protein